MTDFDQGFDAFFASNKTEQKADTFDAGFSSFADQQTQDAGKLRASVGVGTKVGADQAATQQRLASVTGLPLAVVQTNEGEAKAQAKYQEIADLAKTSPVLKQRLMDPNFVALAQDDSSALGSIGDALVSTAKYITSAPGQKNTFMGDAGAGVWQANRGAAGVFQAGAELLAPALDPLAGTVLPENPLRRVAAAFAKMGADSDAAGKELSPPTEGLMAGGVSSGVQSLVGNALMLPLAFTPAGAVATLLGMSAQQGGQSYQDAREKGIAPTPALAFGVSQAVIEYATEKLPMHALLGDAKAGTPLLKSLMHQVGLEVPGEQIATALQDMNEWAVLHPEKPFSAYLADRPAAAAQTLIATIIGVGGNVAITHGIQHIADTATGAHAQQQAAEDSAAHLQQVMALAAQSKLRERSPQTFAETAQAMAEHGGAPTEVRFDARTLSEALSQEDMAKLPSVASQMQEALATGGEVTVPLGELLANVSGTPLEQKLTEHMRVGDNELSQAEAKEASAQAESYLQNEAKRVIDGATDSAAHQASADVVKQKFMEQLTSLNRWSADVNDANATIASHMYTALAGQLGVTPEQAYGMHPIRVTGVNPAEQNDSLSASAPGALSVEGYHFSKQARPIISGHAFGTGLKGSNRELYQNAEDKRLRQRSYFYVNTGNGITPEAGVGGIGHRAQLTNIYDADADPLRIKKGGTLAFESAVLDHGYSGYLTRMSGTQPGQVTMLGDNTVNAEVLGPMTKAEGQRVPEPVARESRGRDQVVDRLNANKMLPSGIMPMSKWAETLQSQMPAEYDALAAAGVFSGNPDEKVYKSALVKTFEAMTPSESYGQAAPTSKVQLPKKLTNDTAVQIRQGERLTGGQAMSVHEVGAYFDSLAKGPLDFNDPKAKAKALKTMVAELQYQMGLEKSGLNWYEEDVADAFRITQQHIPSLSDAAQRQLFAVIAGLQSPGTTARDNWKIAADAFQHYKATGVIPSRNPTNGQLWMGGLVSATKEKSLTFLNNMVQDMGEGPAIEWLMGTHTVKELNEARAKWGNMASGVTGKATDTAMGVVAFGPKVGPFVMNINGIHEVTVDVWATRTFNRYFGKMIGPDGKIVDAPTEPERRVVKELMNAAAEKVGIKPYQVQSTLWFFEQQLFNHLGTGTPSYGFSDGAKRFSESVGGVQSVPVPQRDAGATESFSQSALGASLDDFKPENISGILGKGNWSILTAENPMGVQATPEENATKMADLKKDLDAIGASYTEAVGKYGNVENSLVVTGIDEADAVELGRKYAQDSVLTNRGLVYPRDGSITPTTGQVEVFDTAPDDFYTTIPSTGAKFAIGLDFADESKQHDPLATIISPETYGDVQSALSKYVKGVDATVSPLDRAAAEALLEPVMDQARRMKPAFDETIRGIAAEVGVEARLPGIKKIGRAAEKLVTEIARNADGSMNPGGMWDLLRSTIVVAKPSDVQAAIEAVKQKFDVVRVKDRFANPTPAGYRDVLMNVRLPSGLMAEVQINVPAMIVAKSSGHKLYDMSRSMQAGEERDSSEALQAKLYSEAFAFAQNSASASSALDPLANQAARGNALDGSPANTNESSASLSTGTPSTSNTSAPGGTGNGNINTSLVSPIIAEANKYQKKFLGDRAIESLTPEEKSQYEAMATQQTDTPEFKAWFGDSKVVDHAGLPLVVYHGTMGDFDVFEGRGGISGWFSPNAKLASKYAEHAGGVEGDAPSVVPAYLSLKNPLQLRGDMNDNTRPSEVFVKGQEFVLPDVPGGYSNAPRKMFRIVNDPAFVGAAKRAGYDGFSVREAGRDTYAAFESTQIKSAIGNSGQFNPNDPHILNQGAQASDRGAFVPKTMTLVMLEKADLSTFHHEMAHAYLEILSSIASQPGAPAQLVHSMGVLLKWFGVKDLNTWNGMTLNEKRISHEKFAEHYEAYLFSGKAPSMELQPLFRRFASWMKNVYKSVKAVMENRGKSLTPEVRGVYDRMLATEHQIAEAESARGFQPLFKSAEEVGMAPHDWAQYTLAAQEATETAIETLQTRSLRDMKWTVNAKDKAIKALQRDVASKIKATRAEVADEVAAMPVYAAKSYLDSLKGERTDADLQVAAELFHYGNTTDMLRDIKEAFPIEQTIDGMTDQRLMERYGDLVTPKGIEDAANEAIHNEARARFVATELKALSEGMRLKTADRSSILEKLKECLAS